MSRDHARDEDDIVPEAASQRFKICLFITSTVLGTCSWALTAVIVLAMKAELETSVKSAVEIGLFTSWATSLGASLSVVVDYAHRRIQTNDFAPLTSVVFGQLVWQTLPVALLFLSSIALQGCAMMFVSATIASMNFVASMTLATAFLTTFFLHEPLERREIFGLCFIAGSLASVGVFEETFVDDDDDDDGLFIKNSATYAALGISMATFAGVCFAGINVMYQKILAEPGTPVTPLALNGVVCFECLVLLTVVVYPGLYALGLFDTPFRWIGALVNTSNVAIIPSYVLSKLIWSSLATVLVRYCGAIWTSISGVALIPLLWLVELSAYYGYGASFGVAWSSPASYLQLCALLALCFGVTVYNGLLLPTSRSEATSAAALDAATTSKADSEEPLVGRPHHLGSHYTQVLSPDI